MALSFPDIDPVAVSIGPVQIHWYALAYLFGFLFAWGYARYLTTLYPVGVRPNKEDIDDYISWGILGVLLGGRLGYVLFYNFEYYIDNPGHILRLWEGGMSFHGGTIGLVASIIIYSLAKKFNMFRLADIASCAAPIGFLLGRFANFINGELYGRTTDVAWGVVFPRGGDEPRHPSQIYEGLSEGLLLFIILFAMSRSEKIRQKPGLISVVFLCGYATFRFLIEYVREPDSQLGFIALNLSMGQILSAAMFGSGLFLLYLVKSGRTQNR